MTAAGGSDIYSIWKIKKKFAKPLRFEPRLAGRTQIFSLALKLLYTKRKKKQQNQQICDPYYLSYCHVMDKGRRIGTLTVGYRPDRYGTLSASNYFIYHTTSWNIYG